MFDLGRQTAKGFAEPVEAFACRRGRFSAVAGYTGDKFGADQRRPGDVSAMTAESRFEAGRAAGSPTSMQLADFATRALREIYGAV